MCILYIERSRVHEADALQHSAPPIQVVRVDVELLRLTGALPTAGLRGAGASSRFQRWLHLS